MSTLDTSTEQAEQKVEWNEFQTVHWHDVPHRLRDPLPPPQTPLGCRWVRDEAGDHRLISVWSRRPR